LSAPGVKVTADDESWGGCADAAHAVERDGEAPAFILAALTLTDSGRGAPGGGVKAWPWTIHAKGRGHFFPSKEAAVNEVRRLRAAGVTTIDVGCAQINLRYHPEAFASLEEAFDPVKNVSYALRFLRELRDRFGSWEEAIASYHSIDPKHRARYRKRVVSAWIKVARDNAEFWRRSGVHSASADRPGNSAHLAAEPAREPELAMREGRRAWTRWDTHLSRAQRSLGASVSNWISDWLPERPKRRLPPSAQLALDLGARPRVKASFRPGAGRLRANA
jgi:hypothetical protein